MKSIASFREDELKAIFRFIDRADEDEIASILSEIQVCHGIHVWDEHTKKLKEVRSISTGTIHVRLIIDEEWKEK